MSSRSGSGPSTGEASSPAPLRRRWRRPGSGASVRPTRFAAAEAAGAEGTLFYYNWAQYVNPKTYAAFTKATGIKVKKAFYDSNETLHAKLKGGARGYDLVVPDRVHDAGPHRREAARSRSTGRSSPNVRKNVDPKFHNTPDDPKSTYSVVKDWGTTGFMYRTDKIKERPTTLERVRRAHEEVLEDRDGRQLARGGRLDRDDARLLVQHGRPEGARRGAGRSCST